MQLFNGITMGVIDFYRARYDDSHTEEPVENEGDSRLTKLEAEIAQINDNVNETNDDIEGLDGVLTREFAGAITSDVAKKLLHEIQGKYTDKKLDDLVNDEAIHQSIKDLINFLQPIADPLHNYPTGNFIDKQGVESKSNSLISGELESRKKGVEEVLKSLENQTDERLNKIKTTLDNINKVLSSPSEGNVKQLQKFIWDMLKDSDNSLTISGKKYSESGFCDGTLSNDTLAGLKEVLVKIKKYVDDVKEAILVENKAAKAKEASGKGGNGGVGGVKPAAQVPEAQHDAPKAPEAQPKQESKFFANYSVAQGVQVAEMAASMVLYSPDAKPAVDGDESSGSDSDERSSKGIDQNNVSIAVEKLKALGSAGESTENVYLTEVGGKPYAVRLDSEGCLYPFAVDLTSNRLVFLENNTSCMRYLENKLGVLQDEAYIGWNGRRYVIGRHSDHEKSRLLIEPTTIAGQWVSPDLGKCLAFLNFTNYLRNEPGLDRGKFKNDNPDLKWKKDGKLFVRVKKMDKHDYDKNIDDSERWMYVDLQDFGLEGVSQESDEWRKFIKYNNSEQWEDLRHFDKLDDKFDYSTLDIQAVLDKQARRARAEARAVASGTPSSGASKYESGGGSSSPEAVIVDGNPDETVLREVDQKFDFSAFGLSGGSAFMLGGNLVGVEDGTVTRISSGGCVKETVPLPHDINLGVGQRLPGNLNFGPKKLNVCAEGAKNLGTEFAKVYNEIVGETLPREVQISVSADKKGYVLNLGENKSIPLGGEQFFDERNWQILGYSADKPEDWMKVVCYAVDNYDDIVGGKKLVLNNSNEFGITDSNKDGVVARLQSLVTSENTEKPDLVILPGSESIGSFDNEGQFKTVDGQIVGEGLLKIKGIEYNYSPNAGLGYKFYKNGSNIYSFYLGEFIDGKSSGYGISIWSNGSKYEGNWVGGEMSGKGVYTWENGKKYEGNWVGGEMSGKGVYTWKDGSKYEGNWVGGEMSGKGVYTWKSGAQLECSCDDGVINGGRITMTVNGEQKVFNVEGLINTKNGRDNTHFKIKSDDEYNGRIISQETGVLFPVGHEIV